MIDPNMINILDQETTNSFFDMIIGKEIRAEENKVVKGWKLDMEDNLMTPMLWFAIASWFQFK